MAHDDIHPDHIDPETGPPYAGYSSPSLDAPFSDDWDDSGEPECTDKRGHKWVVSDENDDVCYCERCGSSEF